MADIIDDANDLAERHLQAAMKQRKPSRHLEHTGKCHYCSEDVPSPKIYCDAECAEEHEWLLSRRGANVKVE